MRTAVFFAALLVPVSAFGADRTSSAIAIDFTSGNVLACERCERPMPPSSMSKLMTIELVFQRLKDGRLRLGDRLQVTQSTWRRAHRGNDAKIGLEVGSHVTVEDLLKGIIVQSGGDACLVLAEAIAGGEGEFAELMNDRAGELGLRESHFSNARGIAERGQHMSARDIARLAGHLIRTYPAYSRYFGLAMFAWNGKRFYNRNSLLGMSGVDGLKTGHTIAGGYGLVTSAQRGRRRIIVVVNGQPSETAREREAWRLLELGFDRLTGGASRARAAR
jgi:serine-type D-Ala-D-Ala carboxypeptidase (penicillin-binding protein 5/6)